ncbi:hypothetical protein BKA56DRAFT_662002 [Ilyonectria sp. MPI-CAGE-AT-0026]|nr:hypothetical protein BKA56DRAFT_662002 [Ilyonectria sp. MPI-CAGE-AT-0026]
MDEVQSAALPTLEALFAQPYFGDPAAEQAPHYVHHAPASHLIMSSPQPSRRDDFEVAIIYALPLEYDAVSYIFDEFWDENGDRYGRATGDPNSYTTGRVGKYNVVLALLPHMGKTNAASAAASMRSSYGGWPS